MTLTMQASLRYSLQLPLISPFDLNPSFTEYSQAHDLLWLAWVT